MPTTYYHTCNGRIIGETTAGVRTDYLTDALGSVTATVNSSQAIVNTYRYKPYGEQLAKTGAGADPRFLLTGDAGSRTTLLTWAEQYNRARHYGSKQGQWTTVDSLWPGQLSYVYCTSSPGSHLDASGLRPVPDTTCKKCGSAYFSVEHWIKHVTGVICDKTLANRLATCLKRCGESVRPPRVGVDLDCITKWCDSNVTVRCSHCNEDAIQKCPDGCHRTSIRRPSKCGSMRCKDNLDISQEITICCNATSADMSHRCGASSDVFPGRCDPAITILHELAHVCGTGTECNDDDSYPNLDAWARCMYQCMTSKR